MRLLYWKEVLAGDKGYDRLPANDPYPSLAQDGKANLVGSRTDDGMHMPILDLDYSAQLVPSTKPNHFHLYLNKPIPWEKYRAVIVALGNAGLLEPGVVEWSLKREQSFVRIPGVVKPNA